ncbi:MAG: selenite/tellurite reduction operon c-type cytochrome lipoprotein ExtS [Gemmatimonadota bacterium]
MGALRTSLIALCVVAMLPASGRAAPRCLACHPVHYAQRGHCAGCHRGDERTDRKNIAHRDLIPAAYSHFALPDSPAVRLGAERIEASSCRRCHAWRGEGNALAARLDDLWTVSTPRKIHDAIRRPAAFMPDFRFDEAQIRDIVNAILAEGARRERAAGAEIPAVVHFEDADGAGNALFPRLCGPCHRLLSDVAGGLGGGAVGPNLSGLLTRHYPRTFGGRERWTRDNLSKWLRNPRSVTPAALMPPIPLEPDQLRELSALMAPRDDGEAILGSGSPPGAGSPENADGS